MSWAQLPCQVIRVGIVGDNSEALAPGVAAMSRAAAIRPIGIFAAMRSRPPFANGSAHISVSTHPGATLLTVMPRFPNSGASDAIDRFAGRAEALPQSLRRAREFLHAHADEPLNLAQLAEAAGTGIRALQLGFQRHFGTSISEMLRDIRLAQLNVRLAAASPDDSITDIAFELGFTHLSRMASAYRAKFGETPSATLRGMN